MNKIMKSYLKTFFKNWLSTLFMIIFIVTLAASVIGMVATPLQIYSKMQSAQKQNINYDTNFSSSKNDILYSEDFIVNYGEQYLDKKFVSFINKKISDELKTNKSTNYELNWSTFNNEEKELLTTLVNRALINYRTGANSIVIEINNNDNINANDILNLHIQKSFEEAYYQWNNFLQNDDKTNIIAEVTSIVFSAFYRIYYFASANEVSIDLSSVSINEIKSTDNIKEIITNFIKEFKLAFENWKPKTIKVLSYTIFEQKYLRILSTDDYQHDDRIFLFSQILNRSKQDEKYKLNVNKNFSLTNSSAIATETKKTFEIRSDAGNEFNNIIFDKKTKDSQRTKKWKLNQIPEIVVSLAYASKNKIKIGDEINIPFAKISNPILSKLLSEFKFAPKENFFNQKEIKVKVVGIGQTFDDFVPGSNYSAFSQTMENYGYLYFNQSFINEFRNYSWNFLTGTANYDLEIKIKNGDSLTEAPYNLFTLNNNGKEIKILSNLETSLIPWKQTNIATSLDNLKIRIIINVVLGIIVLVLSFVFINFQLKKEMNETRKQLGIFKSFGYKTSELSWIFSIKTGLLFFFSLIVGFFISIPIQLFAAQAFDNTVTISFSSVYINPLFLLSLFIFIPAFFLLISYITTILYIKEPVLSLMANGRKIKGNIKQELIFKKLFASESFFNWRLRRAFVKTSKGKFYTVQILFACSSFTYILLFGAQTLMTKMLNQTFAVYNEKIDHMFQWGNSNPKIDIKETGGNYTYKNSRNNLNYTYQDYSNYDNTNDYLNVNKTTDDIRYKVDAVIQMTNNYFMSLNTICEKVEFLLPQDEMLYILDTSKLKTDFSLALTNTPNFVSIILNYNLNSKDDAFLQGFNDVKTTGTTNQKINVKESLDPIDSALSLGTLKSNEAQHIFSKDLAYIYALKTAQIDLTYSALPELLKKSREEKIKTTDLVTKITKDAFDNAYEQLKTSELVNKVNILDDKQLSISDNWLLNQFIDIFSVELQPLMNYLVQSNFSNMPIVASNVFKTIQLTDFKNYDSYDYMMNINEIMFDKENDVLFNTVMLSQVGSYNDLDVSARLVNTQFDNYGDFEKAFNFADVSEEQMNRFKNSEKENEGTNIINGIIPYSMAKTYNYKINDVITLNTKTTNKRNVQVRIVGINKNESVKMLVNTIWLSNEHFQTLYYSEELKQNVMFSNLYSKNQMLDIDLKNKDMVKMLLDLKIIEQNFTIGVHENKAIMTDILKPIFNLTQEMYKDAKTDTKSVINPYILGISSMSITNSFVVNTLVINKATEIVNQIMLVFVLLTTLLLAIILVVIIGIIVEEAKIIILTLQALGYKDKEINWIVIGSYAIGALISFIVAYIGSVIFWKVLLNWIAGKFSVYIFMTVDLKTILITLTVMSIVLLFGWYASNKQFKRNSLTQITSLT